MFEFIADLGTLGIFLLVIIFILFVFAIKKILGIIKNIIIIVIASVLFPVVLNMVFGFDIPLDMDTILGFVFVGIGAYVVYMIAKAIYFFLKVAEKAGRAALSPIKELKKRRDEELKEKMKEHLEIEGKMKREQEEREKLNKKMQEEFEERQRHQEEIREQEKKKIIEEIKKPKPKKEHYKDYVKIRDADKKRLVKNVDEIEEGLKSIKIKKDSETKKTFIEPLPEIRPKKERKKKL